MSVQSIDALRLRELLSYDPEKGTFTWLQGRGGRKFAGKLAGSLNQKGYIEITVDGRSYWAHRLVWLHVYGVWPKEIDHINRDRSDNRISNLRDVSHYENIQNRLKGDRKEVAGFWRFRKGFRAAICVNGATHDLGCFSTAEAASNAYKSAQLALLQKPPLS